MAQPISIDFLRQPKYRLLLLLLLLPVCSMHAQTSDNMSNSLSGRITMIDIDGNPVDDASDVVIFLEGVNGDLISEPKQPVIMSHKKKQFSPRVVPLKKGDSVDFINDDGTFHNVFSLSKTKTFDLGIYDKGTSKIVTFEDPGLIKIYCNLHPQMISNIVVLNNNHYSLSNASGEYEIKNVPTGEYTLRTWHELSQATSQKILIDEGENNLSDITINLTKKTFQHKNKFGNKYKVKY